MISVLVLTLNEETTLPTCLNSLKWCDDIVILDSFSDDKTTEIAKSYGARFFQREFDDYASQRNFGLGEIKYKNPWLLMLDADEEVPPDLLEELISIVAGVGNDVTLVQMRRKDFFQGRWIKHSSGYPTWFGRLMKIGHVRVDRAVNEEYITGGKVITAKGHLRHYPFRKGMANWFEKHNRYSTMEAELIVLEGLPPFTLGGLFQRDPASRRRAQKSLLYRMPFRPFLVFILLYFFRGGFLDGKPGLIFCLLRSQYEFMINCKIRELDRKNKGLPV